MLYPPSCECIQSIKDVAHTYATHRSFYTGHHAGPEPPKGLCIAQSALLAPVPAMYTSPRIPSGCISHLFVSARASVAALSLVYYTWSMFRLSKENHRQNTPMSRKTTVCVSLMFSCFGQQTLMSVTACFCSIRGVFVFRNRRLAGESYTFCPSYSTDRCIHMPAV